MFYQTYNFQMGVVLERLLRFKKKVVSHLMKIALHIEFLKEV